MTTPVLDMSSPDIKDLVYAKTNVGGWIFDAFLKISHTSRLTITDQPVQTGSALTDNAFLQPRELSMDIGMSDVATSFVKGQFSGGHSRSVKAYQVLKDLQSMRVPIQIFTRLGIYPNMLIEVLSVPDDFTTLHGLKATVTFREILVAKVKTVKISSRPQVTNSSKRGNVQPTQPTESILKGIFNYILGQNQTQ